MYETEKINNVKGIKCCKNIHQILKLSSIISNNNIVLSNYVIHLPPLYSPWLSALASIARSWYTLLLSVAYHVSPITYKQHLVYSRLKQEFFFNYCLKFLNQNKSSWLCKTKYRIERSMMNQYSAYRYSTIMLMLEKWKTYNNWTFLKRGIVSIFNSMRKASNMCIFPEPGIGSKWLAFKRLFSFKAITR